MSVAMAGVGYRQCIRQHRQLTLGGDGVIYGITQELKKAKNNYIIVEMEDGINT